MRVEREAPGTATLEGSGRSRRASSEAPGSTEAPGASILVTVGTDHHPFDRLLRWVDSWAGSRHVPRGALFLQTGSSTVRPRAEVADFLPRSELQARLESSTALVCHGGPGAIMEARREGLTPIVVPRLRRLGEVVDDHQVAFAARLADLGEVHLADTEEGLHSLLDRALADPASFRGPPATEVATEAVVRLEALAASLVEAPLRSARPGPPRSLPGPFRGGPAMERWPSVSVVIATRDRPQLVVRAVRAALSQRYPGNIECVLVFDQSEPVALPIAATEGREVRTVVNERSPGLAGARNTGILAATGEFVAFCDDDDEWLPDKLRLQMEALNANPGAVVASGGMRVHHDGRVVERVVREELVTFRSLLRSRRADIHPSSLLVRRSDVVDRIGLVDEEIPGSYGEDYEWLLRAARIGPIVTVPQAVLNVFWHRASFFAERWDTIASALVYLLRRYPEFRFDRRGLARIQGQIAFALAAAGRRGPAGEWARRSFWTDPLQPRTYLAAAVRAGLIPASAVVRLANKAGRGV